MTPEHSSSPKTVLLLVLDGIRPDVLRSATEAGETPNLGALAERGEAVWDAVSVFPSITPAATALEATPFPAAQFIVSLAILVGLTVVVMILMLGQSRVAFAMSRDNLLPPWLARVHPSFRTPYRITIITGIVASILAFFLPLTTLGELVNIGTLSAFVLVSIGVLVLRRTQPDLPRAFRTPLVPAVPIAAAALCLFVMGFLTIGTWVRFLGWMALGIVFYFAYSRGHSRLGRTQAAERSSEGS